MLKLVISTALALAAVSASAETISISQKFHSGRIPLVAGEIPFSFNLKAPRRFSSRTINGISVNVYGSLTTLTVLTASKSFGELDRNIGSILEIYNPFDYNDVTFDGELESGSVKPGDTGYFTTVTSFDRSFNSPSDYQFMANGIRIDLLISQQDYQIGGQLAALSGYDKLLGQIDATIDFSPEPVPEPAALALFGLGVGALALSRARARRA